MTGSLEEELYDLVSIYSPTGREGQASIWFCELLRNHGFSRVSLDAAGSAHGAIPGQGLKVTLCGHIDTVPGKLPVNVENGEVTGRGSVDAKSSLISLLHGGLMAKERGFQGTINMIAAVGEEGTGKGIQEVAMHHEKGDYAVLGEPSGTNSITVGYRGRLLVEANYMTDPVHASAPWMGQNAIESAIRDWSALKSFYGVNSEFSKVSVALTELKGGSSHNVNPSKSRMLIDVRFPPSVKGETIMQEIRGVLSMNGDPLFRREIKLKGHTEPYVSNIKTDLVRAFKNSITRNTGKSPGLVFKSGSGDMSYLASSWKIPCITYGPGNTQLSHTNRERISIAEVKESAIIIADALICLEEK